MTAVPPAPVTVLASLNDALHQLMERSDDVYVIGEDVLDPYGGAFKVTKGLSTRFPSRVLTTRSMAVRRILSISGDRRISNKVMIQTIGQMLQIPRSSAAYRICASASRHSACCAATLARCIHASCAASTSRRSGRSGVRQVPQNV